MARKYLIEDTPQAVLNIIDGTNLERNLYLTTQLLELGIPVVVAVNMMDLVRKNGDTIDVKKLSADLGCPVVEISAMKGTGIEKAAQAAVEAARSGDAAHVCRFDAETEAALTQIEDTLLKDVPQSQKRWFAVKVFERDDKALEQLALTPEARAEAEKLIAAVEQALDDDSESIITDGRYTYITKVLKDSYKKNRAGELTVSDKIDRIVTNRWLALPIFAAVMFAVYFLSVTTVGGWATDFVNDGVFGDGWYLFGDGRAAYEQASEDYIVPGAEKDAFIAACEEKGLDPNTATGVTATAELYDEDGTIEETIPVNYAVYETVKDVEEPDPADYGIWVPGIPGVVSGWLEAVDCAPWLQGLIVDGIIAGVGAVLGFVPQMFVLFLLLAFLEYCGYMARVAFVMDRIFRKFGLSGKSFIPMLIGTGCGVPGIMASRTIENERDRRMTIITTTFIPCGAKLPIIALIAGALFKGAWWVAPSAYFIGIAAIVLSGIILKKTAMFAGEPAPFVMELPAYHWPTFTALLRSMWERGWSFIKKAGTIILLATTLVWFLSNYGFQDGRFGMVDMDNSMLAAIGTWICFLFTPLGWGNWQAAVATITGLIAKENVVGTFGVLYGGFDEVAENGWQIWTNLNAAFTPLAAYSFLVFNLLCAPCFAAIGAIRREMNSAKWTWFAVGYQCLFAYCTALVIYQLGAWFTGQGNVIGTIVAVIILGVLGYMLFKPYKEPQALTEHISAV